MKLHVTYGNEGTQPWRTDEFASLALFDDALYGLDEAGRRYPVGMVTPKGFQVDGSHYRQAAVLAHFANRDYVYLDFAGKLMARSIRGYALSFVKSQCFLKDVHSGSPVAEYRGGLWRPFNGSERLTLALAEVRILPTAHARPWSPLAYAHYGPRARASSLAERVACLL